MDSLQLGCVTTSGRCRHMFLFETLNPVPVVFFSPASYIIITIGEQEVEPQSNPFEES